jgi:hypothetical protein
MKKFISSVLGLTFILSSQSIFAQSPPTGTTAGDKSTVTLTPSALDFGNQAVKGTSPVQTITLKNGGKTEVGKVAFTVDGTDKKDFELDKKSTTCKTTLAAGTECKVGMVFKPTSAAAKSATLTVKSDAAGSPNTAALKGTGVIEQATVTLTPTSLDFGNQAVKVASAVQTVTLKNEGKAELDKLAFTVDGTDKKDFEIDKKSTTCKTKLAVGAECKVGLSFKPTTAAAKTASLTIKSTAAGSPNTVALKGTGTSEPAATATLTLTPTSLDFGNQAVKAASAVQTITLKNDGKADLGKLAFTVDGTDKKDFALDKKSTTCKTTLAAGKDCTVGVIFTPTTAAAKSATLTVKSDAAGSPNTVALKGTGVVEQAAATLTPSSLDFGNQVLKQASAVKTVTLKNDGKAELGKLAFTVDGTDKKDFALDKKSTTCKTTLAAGKDCTVGVIFTPTTAAAKSATLTIKSDAPGSPHTATLKGTGVVEQAPVTLTPTSLDFGNQGVKEASAEKTVTLKNNGTANLTKIEIATGGTNKKDFDIAKSSTCKTSLAAGAECKINLTFKPSALGAMEASLTVTTSAGSSPSVTLKGTGVAAVAGVELSTPSIDFGNQGIKVTSIEKTVTLKSVGTAALNKLKISLDGTDKKDFEIAKSTTCKGSVMAGETCQINVMFTPSAKGNRQATLIVESDATTSPNQVMLVGMGVETPVKLTPSPLDFKKQAVNQTSAEKTVTLKNEGKQDLTGIAITIEGANKDEFGAPATMNTCQKTLAAGKDCTIKVTFTPKAAGDRQAILTVVSNAASSPDKVQLMGIGTESTSGEVKQPVLGNAAAIDKDGKIVTAPATQFKGGIALSDAQGKPGAFKDNIKIPIADAVTVSGAITVPPEQVGKAAEFFAVGFYTPTAKTCSGKKEDGYYYMMVTVPHNTPATKTDWYCPWDTTCPATTGTGTRAKDFVQWNGEIGSLQPFKTGNLEATTMVDLIDNSHFPALGLVCITFGYRLETGGTVFFHDKSIDVTIEK